MSDFDMDQELARKLLDTGGVLVLLGVPEGTEFGIDMKSWNTAGEFRGIKMIPPGFHFIHYAPVSKTGDVSPRRGFMHNFKVKEFVVKIWNKENEDMTTDNVTEESVQKLKDNLYNIDRFLAPYPYDIYRKWVSLSSNISDELAAMITPLNGIISSAVELISCDNNDRPRGKLKTADVSRKMSENDGAGTSMQSIEMSTNSASEQSVCKNAEISVQSLENSSNSTPETIDGDKQACDFNMRDVEKVVKRRSRPSTLEEKEEELLPHLKPTPGTELRFTKFPDRNYPENATPAEITKHSLDQTYVLDTMLSRYKQANSFIGELEFAYVCFLIGHSLDAFEQWKKLVTLLCSCEDAIVKRREIYLKFITSLETQILEIPEEFLADIVQNNNVVYVKLREFFKTVYNADIENKLKCAIERFKQNLTDKLQWDFSDIDQEEEDERPVIVDLP